MIPRTGNFEEVLGKYYVRGWKEPSFDGMVLESLDPLRQSEFGAGRRWPNDSRSWVVNFEQPQDFDLNEDSNYCLSLNQ